VLNKTRDLLKPSQSILNSVFQPTGFKFFIIMKKHLKNNAKPGSVIYIKRQMRQKTVLLNVHVVGTNT
jgi:hypothetical protein